MADTLDLITLAEGYRAVNDNVSAAAGSGNHDTVLAQWITAVSQRVDDVCGPVVARAVTELHNGGCRAIRPFTTPVLSVTTLKEYDNTTEKALTAESNSTKPADGYLLDRDHATSHNVTIVRRSSGSDATFVSGRRNVELVLSAGRYATTATVGAKFKLAAAEMIARLQKQYGAAWASGNAPFVAADGIGFFRVVDPVVDEFLHADRLLPGIA